MGLILEASCECGFSESLKSRFGAHACRPDSYVPSYFLVPAYCTACRKIMMIDRMHGVKRCYQCNGKVILYGRNKLVSPRKNNVFWTGPQYIGDYDEETQIHSTLIYDENSSDGHLCPRCQNYTLSFKPGGSWD